MVDRSINRMPVGRLSARVRSLRGSNGQRRTEITIEKARRENDKMITCVKLALTAQLICVSDHTFVCTDNGSLAQLIGVSAYTRTKRDRGPVEAATRGRPSA